MPGIVLYGEYNPDTRLPETGCSDEMENSGDKTVAGLILSASAYRYLVKMKLNRLKKGGHIRKRSM